MATKEDIENAALTAALDIFLSDYPRDRHPETVLEMVTNNDDEVLFWEPFEDWTGESLAETIWAAHRSILGMWQTLTMGDDTPADFGNPFTGGIDR